MPEENAPLAVLIDGDNASPAIIRGLLAEVAKYGNASVRRIYGDWTKPNLGSWKTTLLEHSIQPIQQFAYTTGKNATDGAMIIDAMDLLYTGRFSGFCIVSSDSDFARLASRVREQGVTVYGFGERKTPKPFVTACDKFIYVDLLRAPEETQQVTAPATVAPPATAQGGRLAREQLAKVPGLLALLRAAVRAVAEEDGWANLGPVGSQIARQSPDFDSRSYGYAQLSGLIEAVGVFDVDRSGGARVRIRSKD
jgi:uncharacterized LabA/DUF88 family protein